MQSPGWSDGNPHERGGVLQVMTRPRQPRGKHVPHPEHIPFEGLVPVRPIPGDHMQHTHRPTQAPTARPHTHDAAFARPKH